MVPAPREAFLRHWVNPDHRRTLGYVEDGHIRSYGTIRACREGYKIGPLFCDDRTTAERLLAALVAHIDEGPVFLDVPVPNADGVALARDLGLEPVFETARMYRGPAPNLRLDRVFGITSFELG